MAHAGQTISNPRTQETITFLKTATDTGGELLQLECCVAAGGGLKIPPHMHPFQNQRFEVRSGQMTFQLGDEERLLSKGDTITVPMKVFYNWSNTGSDDLCFIAEYTPAGHWEDIFESMFELERQAHSGKRVNQLLASAVLATTYKDHLRIKGIPEFVYATVFPMLGWLGRRLGYRSTYQYGGTEGKTPSQ